MTLREKLYFIRELEKNGLSDHEFVKTMKRDVRKMLHVDDHEGRRTFSDDGEGYIERVKIPDDVRTMEEAEEYFREVEHIAYEPTYYDCTGQLFTVWHSIFRIGDEFVLYHCVAVDC